MRKTFLNVQTVVKNFNMRSRVAEVGITLRSLNVKILIFQKFYRRQLYSILMIFFITVDINFSYSWNNQ